MLLLESQELTATCTCLYKVWRSGFSQVCYIQKCPTARIVQKAIWKDISGSINSKLAVWSRKFDKEVTVAIYKYHTVAIRWQPLTLIWWGDESTSTQCFRDWPPRASKYNGKETLRRNEEKLAHWVQ